MEHTAESHQSHVALLFRPAYLTSLFLLMLNDGLLKSRWPSWFTGKLSDFAGLFLAPILLLVLVELVPRLRCHKWLPWRRLFAFGSIAVVFSLAQLTDSGATLYELMFRPARWIPTWNEGFSLTQDPTDLVAVTALVASYVWSDRILHSREVLPVS